MGIGGSLSGISFTGLASGIDATSIVNQLMQIEAFPLLRMQQQQLQLSSRQNLYAQLKTLLVSFNSATSGLNTAASFNPIKSSSSDTEVATISATTSAAAGIYDLTVSKLATSHKVSSAAQSSADTALGYSGSFVINGRAVSIEASDTLSTIAGKINSSSANVTASIIDGGAGAAYLTITASKSGASNDVQIANLSGTALSSLGIQTGAASFRDQVDADSVRSFGFSSSTTELSSLLGESTSGSFLIGTATIAVNFASDSLQDIADAINADPDSNASAVIVEVEENGVTLQKLEITGDSGLPVITDTDGLLEAIGFYERAFTNELVVAQDAEYTLDGFAFTSAKNTITDTVPGVTITLLKADEATPETATLTLSKDDAAIKTSFESLKTTYNAIVSFIRLNSEFDPDTFQSGPLFGDSLATQAESTLSSLLFNSIGNGNYTNLAQLGFGYDEEGLLEIDSTILDQAISSDPEGVRKLMMATGVSTSNDLKFITSTSATQNSGPSGFIVDVTQLATYGNTTATIAQTLPNELGEILTFDGSLFGGVSVDLIVPINGSLADLVSQINSDDTLKDSVVASIEGGLLKIESKKYGTNGNFTVVSDKTAATNNSGIGTTGGTLTDGVNIAGTINGLDATGLGQFLTGDEDTDVEGMQVLYTGTTTGNIGTITYTRGLATELTYSLTTFTDSVNGIISTTDKTLQSQIDSIGDRIVEFQEHLDARREFLSRKFLEMERAISIMQSQQAQLFAIIGR